MSITFTDQLDKPSGITALPNQFIRPAFGNLYGFDTPQLPPTPVIDGALLTELSEPLVTEADEILQFEP